MSDIQSFHQTPLNRWAATQAHLSCDLLLGMLGSVVHHLKTLHASGKGHGGITPDSLVVIQETQLIDLLGFTACAGGSIVRGTDYSPPEADLEPPVLPSARSDIYSLAAVLYEALNAHPPVPASVRSKRGGQLAFSSTLASPGEKAALLQALSLDPSQRPESIADFEILLRRPSPQPPHQVQPILQSSIARAPAKPVSPPEPPAPRTVERVPMNLTKGKICEVPLLSLFPGGEPDWQVSFPNLHDLGLQLDEAQTHLVGIPLVDGEHLIRVQLTRRDAPADRPRLERSIMVTINPDPMSIWKNLPSNQDDQHWKPDNDKFAMPTPTAFLVAASVRGRSHAQEGLFRDDEFRLTCDRATGWHLLAVADGAGSAKLSRRGSQLACQHALKYLEEQLHAEAGEEGKPTISKQTANDDLTEEQARSLAYSWLGGAAREGLKAITDEANAHEPPRIPKEYATTLLLSAARLTKRGWIILTFGIGDGGIGLLKRDGTVQVMSTPDSGEFSSETIFLTSKNLWMTTEGISKRLHVALVPDLHALVLMTDGITDPLFPTEVSLSDKDVWLTFWTDLWKQARLTPDNEHASDELLQWSGFYSKGNHDDRTIALLLPLESKVAEV